MKSGLSSVVLAASAALALPTSSEPQHNPYEYFASKTPDLVELAVRCGSQHKKSVLYDNRFHYTTNQYLIYSADKSLRFIFVDGSPYFPPDKMYTPGDVVSLSYGDKEVFCYVAKQCTNKGYSAEEQRKAVEKLRKEHRSCGRI